MPGHAVNKVSPQPRETPILSYRKARRHRERADHGAAGLDGVDAEAGDGEGVEQLAGDARFQLPLRRHHRPQLDLAVVAPVVFQLLGHALVRRPMRGIV